MRFQETSSRRLGVLDPGLAGAGLATGGLLALAGSEPELGPLIFVALVPLLRALDRGPSPGQAACAGWLAGVVLFGAAGAWVPSAGYRGTLLAVLALYVAGLALAPALFAAALAALRRRDRVWFLLAAPGLWIATEWLRSQGTLGYPWYHLGYALSERPDWIRLGALGGLYGLSLWIVAANVALVWSRRASPVRALAVLGALAAPLLLEVRGGAELTSGDLTVAAVQPQLLEPGWQDPERFNQNLDRLLELSGGAGSRDADLLVWPESAFERALRPEGDPFLAALAAKLQQPLLTGAWRVERDPSASRPRIYNTAALARPEGAVAPVGDKVHPVPFYEAAPTTWFERLLHRAGLWSGGFHAGERAGMVTVAGSDGPVKVGVLVCLDASYPTLARDLQRRGARAIVVIANEAQTTDAAARQHARVSRMRAVETGLPLVRVANTGPTEWVDATGQLRASLPTGIAAARAERVRLGGTPTLYARLGDAPAFATALLPALLLPWIRSRSRSRRNCTTHAEETRS